MKNFNHSYLFLFILFFAVCSFAINHHKNISIVFIGDSITQSVGTPDPEKQSPPVKAAEYLQKELSNDSIQFSNQGHSGATTFDFLPGTHYFENVESAAKTLAKDNTSVFIFSIMLGTNDSAIKGPHGAPASPEKYAENVRTIIDRLLSDFPKSKIIIHHPLWYSPNTYNGAMYLQEGLNRLQQYDPEIAKLIKFYNKEKPYQVFDGDHKGFAYFEQNYKTDMKPEDGHHGIFHLHPNEKGAVALGEFWAKAIKDKIISNQ